MSSVRAAEAQGATFVELFFDLVFVYAITQLTASLLHDLTWSGVGKVAILFWLVWWAWTQFTWTLNLADTEHVLVRLPTLVATAVAFFLAQSVPEAFTTAGAWFAISYVTVRLLGLAVQTWVLASDRRLVLTKWTVTSQIGIALVLIGGFVEPDLRLWFWGGAFLADIFAAAVAARGEWILEAGHFAERHGLIVIIALGESLIAAGIASADVERNLLFASTIAAAVIAACALWWTYFGTLNSRLESRLADQTAATTGAFARDVYSFWHAGVVAGVIGVAAAFERAISHGDEPLGTGAGLALALGVGLYAGSLAAAAWRAGIRTAATSRAVVALLALAAIPLFIQAPASLALWGLALVIIALDVYEARSLQPRAA